MKRGLIIGKFMPLHKGHIALIEFASNRCDELIVSMSYTNNDVIDPWLRLGWINEQFKDNPKVRPNIIKDDFDNEKLPLEKRTAIWAEKMKEVYPRIDTIFSSESYGTFFAHNLGALHLSFDMNRSAVPISATEIRKKPLTNWEFIPKHIQPYFVKKICFYGPESTGKSTMAIKMATYYKTEYVPEAARDVLTSNEFGENEIVAIGHLQHQYIQEKLKTANRLLFFDTDAITTSIYSQHYLGRVPSVISELEKKTIYDYYFLLDIDTIWIADPLRDQGHRRKEMMEIFEQELIKRNIAYTIISGDYPDREQKIIDYIDAMIKIL